MEADAEMCAESVVAVLHSLGFRDVRREELQRAHGGIVNEVYVSATLAVKIRRGRDGRLFYANCVVSDWADRQATSGTRGPPGPLAEGRLPVVKMLAYDCSERCAFEALVMARAPGGVLEDALALDALSDGDVRTLVAQLCRAARRLQELRFESFGVIWLDERFPTYGAFLHAQFEHLERKLVEQRRVQPDLLRRARSYWERHRSVFEDERRAVLVHDDLHAGNLIHAGARLEAILDFDSALKAAPIATLFSLLKFLERPLGCFNESQYGGRHFLKLVPIVRAEFSDLFADKFLTRKLSLLYVLFCLDNLDGNEDPFEIERWTKCLEEENSVKTELNSDGTHFRKILEQYDNSTSIS